MFDMMTWWCDKGIDGFRMDVISCISKTKELPDGPVGKSGYGDFGPYCANGPHVHDYLQQMNREVLSKYDLITVGECSGVTVEEAKRYASSSGRELNMVFQFEHVELDEEEGFKWTDKRIKLTELKKTMSRWQTGLEGKAWNSLYFCNHDQPRMISRLGDESPAFREASAKMLGTCLHMLKGTPYVYQGEELGMTGYPFTSLEEFRDVESINAYREMTEKGIVTPEKMFAYISRKGRDNARTPMQWDDSPQAGFTTGTPWIAVNPNYKEVNAKEQLAREDSVFHYYQKLIRLRRQHDIIVYGDYELLLPESEELYVYVRSYEGKELLVVCSFAREEIVFAMPQRFAKREGKVLISNYKRTLLGKQMTLAPFESYAVLFSK